MIPSLVILVSFGCLESERQIAHLLTNSSDGIEFSRLIYTFSKDFSAADAYSQLSAISTGYLAQNARGTNGKQTIFELMRKNYQNYRRFALVKGATLTAFSHWEQNYTTDSLVSDMTKNVQLNYLLADLSGFTEQQLATLAKTYTFTESVGSRSFPAITNKRYPDYYVDGTSELLDDAQKVLADLYADKRPFLLWIQLNDRANVSFEQAVGECAEAIQIERQLGSLVSSEVVFLSISGNGPSVALIDESVVVDASANFSERIRYVAQYGTFIQQITPRNAILFAYGAQLNNKNMLKRLWHISDLRYLCEEVLAGVGIEIDVKITNQLNYFSLGALLMLFILLVYFVLKYNVISVQYKKRSAREKTAGH